MINFTFLRFSTGSVEGDSALKIPSMPWVLNHLKDPDGRVKTHLRRCDVRTMDIEPSNFNFQLLTFATYGYLKWNSSATHFHSRFSFSSAILPSDSSLFESDYGLQLHVHRDQRSYNWGVLKRTQTHAGAHMIGEVNLGYWMWCCCEACDDSIDNDGIFQHLIPKEKHVQQMQLSIMVCKQFLSNFHLKHLTSAWLPAFHQVRLLGFSQKSGPGAMQLLQLPQKIIFFMPFRTQFITARLPPNTKRHKKTLQDLEEHVWTG